MKKSKAVSLALVSTLVAASCQEKHDDRLYIRGNEEDDYYEGDVGFSHGFYPYYGITPDYRTYNPTNNTFGAQKVGYESNSISPDAVKSSSYGRYFGYSSAHVSRGGFGSTGAHGFWSGS